MQENKEYYWSLVLEPGWVQAGIWTVSDKQAEIVSSSKALAWSETDEELIHGVDQVLTEAIQEFPEEETEPSKTVFGVPPSWVSEGTIKKEYLDKIRKICSKLSLTPSGFVVLSESIAHEVKVEEGSPLTGIVIGVSKGFLDITMFKLGNLIGSVNVGRSVNIADDVVEGLTRFGTAEHFPSRVIIYNGDDQGLEDFRQELIQTEWSKYENIRFLHSPQVELVDNLRRITAVSLAGASEISEVSGVKHEKKIEKEQQENVTKSEELTASDIGFVMGQEVGEQAEISSIDPEQDFVVRGEGISEHKKFKLPFPKIKLTNPLKFLNKRNVNPGLPSAKFPAGPKRLVIIIGVLLILGLIGFFIFWWYYPKADIVLFVSPKTLEETTFVTLDENASEFDMEDMVIPAETKTVEVNGSKTLAASGTKLIGDKAKGKVTIRNGTSSEIKLTTEMEIIGPNDLKYNVGSETTISEATSPSSPGSVEVEIVAEDIGATYNLAKGESLSVSNFPKSEVDAVIEEDLSGGTSREVTAVSERDLENLAEGLTEELTQDAKNKLNQEVSGNDLFVEGAIRTEEIERDFSHEAGEEADEVTLTMSVKAVGLIISEDIVTKLGREVFTGQVPEGFNLKDEQIDAQFELTGEDDGVWDFEVKFSANLLPEIDPDSVSRKIAGKYPQQAEEYLSIVPGFKRAEIKIKPTLPSKLGNIPRVLKHISVEIVSDR